MSRRNAPPETMRTALHRCSEDGLNSDVRVLRPTNGRLTPRLICRDFAYSSPAVQRDAFGLRPRNHWT